MAAEQVIGVDLGGTNARLAVVDSAGAIRHRESFHSGAFRDAPQEALLERLAEALRALVRNAGGSGARVEAVGLGVPGIVRLPAGVVVASPNFPRWREFPVRAGLESQLPVPVVVDNDANAAALGEQWRGAGRAFESFLCLTLGTGVGGGLILEGRLWRGADGMAGEVGHVTVEPGGPACNCGNRGCLEQYASGRGIARRVREALAAGSESALAAAEPLTAEAVHRAARAGDRVAQEAFHQAGVALGIALGGLVNVLNIQGVVIGGQVSQAWTFLGPPLIEELCRRSYVAASGTVRVVQAELGDDAGILGAARLALRGAPR